MAGVICVDACLAAKRVMWEQDSPQALELLAEWEAGDVLCVAPSFFFAELRTIFRKQAARGLTDSATARENLEDALAVRVTLSPVPWLRAYDIAEALGHLHLYDSCDLAVAEAVEADFWTCDRPLARDAAPHFPWVHLL